MLHSWASRVQYSPCLPTSRLSSSFLAPLFPPQLCVLANLKALSLTFCSCLYFSESDFICSHDINCPSPMTFKASFPAQILPPSLRLQYPKVSQSGGTICKLIPKTISSYSWAQLDIFQPSLRLVMCISSGQQRVGESDIFQSC